MYVCCTIQRVEYSSQDEGVVLDFRFACDCQVVLLMLPTHADPVLCLACQQTILQERHTEGEWTGSVYRDFTWDAVYPSGF